MIGRAPETAADQHAKPDIARRVPPRHQADIVHLRGGAVLLAAARPRS